MEIILLFRFLNWLFRLSLNNLNWGTESITVLCQLDLYSEWTVTKFLGKNSDWLCEWTVADNVKKCGNLKQNTNPFRFFFQVFFRVWFQLCSPTCVTQVNCSLLAAPADCHVAETEKKDALISWQELQRILEDPHRSWILERVGKHFEWS